ncbi:methionine gamma-lyase [Effusibacillus lacus]|uniref:L-methionine gamma-lyase n=1 Tax=Effusibacillus lacus TaxID=1348429 RepID=A0A292YD90_9BACL|nr:methionine gamma-lyase [Effusibacillus lacus]TCS71275.1 methionine-gamma-lyase [Effusibacillus lacus]GAX89902.1 methionine gamma-lyase [Effusibacillus lacus]
MSNQWKGYTTKLLHEGHRPEPVTGALTQPIYQTSTFVFSDADQGAARFGGTEEGYMYSRLGNPTVDTLAERIAVLENGEMGLAFGSGMAAISHVMMALVKSGDHIIASDALYGCSFALFQSILSERFGVNVSFVDTSSVDKVEAAVRPETTVLYLETPANPTMKLSDIQALSRLAKAKNIKVLVDNTFMSPYLQRPLELGADVVIHSATKYIGGHGDVVGGLAVGPKELMSKIKRSFLKDLGGVMGPFDAFLLLRGLKTLTLRVERHCSNAMEVAEFLKGHPAVDQVYYPGLSDFPQYNLAKKQMHGFGGTLSFVVKGGLEKGRAVMNSVRLCQLAVSLGDVHTLIQHPASMTHAVIPKEERLKVGITDGLVRLSVGIEDVNDIIEDLDQALSKHA